MRAINGGRVVHVFLMQMESGGGNILVFTYKKQIRIFPF